jgi:DNA-binding transcriptional ArsR family regulator
MELTPINADQITPEKPKDGRTYIVVPYRVLLDRKIQIGRLRVLLALCSYARKTGEAWPGIPRLAQDTGYAESVVSRHLTALTRSGYIKAVNNSYTVGMKAKPRLVIYDPDQEPDAEHWMPESNQESLIKEQEAIRESKQSIAQPLSDSTSLFVCWRTLMQQRYNITPPDEPTLYRRLTYRYTLEGFKEAARDHLSATSAPPPSVGVLVR